MKKSALFALLGVVLSAAAAQAQNAGLPNFLQRLPAGTVVGRLGLTAGPAEAIPFASIAPRIAGLSVNSLLFTGATSGTINFSVPAVVTSYSLKFPATQGTAGQGLANDGAGNLSWASVSGTVDTGALGNIAVYTGTSKVAGTTNLNISGGALTAGIAGTTQGSYSIAGSTSGVTTLAGPVSGGGTWTFPTGSDTVVGLAATQTLTNKILTAPTIAGGTHTALTGLGIRSTGAAFDLTLATSEVLTAGRTLSFVVGDAARTLSLGGNLTTAGAFTTSGAFALTLTQTGATNVTLPTTGTLATLAGTEALTNKTFNGNTWTTGTGTLTIGAGKTLAASNSLTFTGTDGTSFAFPGTSDTVATLAAAQTFTNKTLTAPTINGGTHTAITNLGIRSTGTGAFDLTLANTENLTAGRTLTLTLNNAARTLNMSGDITTAAAFTTAGGNPITLTTTGSTGVTLPTSGTLATRDTSQTFSGSNIFSALTQFTDGKFSSGKIYPTSDSTTALQVTKADGTTRIMNFDTTNARVGINKTAGAFDLDVNGAFNVGGRITFGTLDGASLAASPSTITDLTINNSPSSSNDYILYYNAAAGAIRRCTVGSCAAAATAGVSSLNGLTGGLSVVAGNGLAVSAVGSSVTVGLLSTTITPQHRITLATGTPVMTSSQAAKTTVYVTPYSGNLIPIYDGTNFIPTSFAETSQATTDTTKSPAAVASSSVYDIFCWVDSGTNRCTRGPAWTNTTTRSAGTALVAVNGIYLNNASITNGPVAQRGTYVGTITSNASSQIDYIFGASASGGTAAFFGVWNAYNRVSTGTVVTDSGVSYTYSSATIRQARASAGNQISFVIGLSEDAVFASNSTAGAPTISTSGRYRAGLGFDVTNAYSRAPLIIRNNSATNGIQGGGSSSGQWLPGIGLHFIAAVESDPDASGCTFDQNSDNALEAIIRN